MYAWLDDNCGAAGWTTAAAGFAGIVNDAVAFYFENTASADAVVARFCCGYRVEAISPKASPAAALRRRPEAARPPARPADR
jgi:hypothetical protein